MRKNHPNNRFFDGNFIPEDKTIHWTCNEGKFVRVKAKTSEYFEGKHNSVRSIITRGEDMQFTL